MNRKMYEQLIHKLYDLVKEELEIETDEGKAVFHSLTDSLYPFHPAVIAAKRRMHKHVEGENLVH